MAKFIYRSKGSADDWTEDVIEADDKEAAQQKLDKIYGIKRDQSGKQTNPEFVLVEIIRQQ